MKASCHFLTGKHTEFSQTRYAKYPTPRGTVYGYYLFSTPSGDGEQTIIDSILGTINTSVFQACQATKEVTGEFLASLGKICKDQAAQAGLVVQVMLFASEKNKVQITRLGDIQVLIYRETKAALLFTPGQNTTIGLAEEGDYYLIGPNLLVSGLAGKNLLRNDLESKDPHVFFPNEEEAQKYGLLFVNFSHTSEKRQFRSKLSLPFRPKSVLVSASESLEQKRRRRRSLYLSIGFLCLFLLSLFFGTQRHQAQKKEERFTELKLQIEEKIGQASSLKSLDLESALAVARQADKLVEEMALLGINSDEQAALARFVDELLSQTGEEGKTKAEEIYDLSLIASGFSPSVFYYAPPDLYLLDTSQHRLDTLNTQRKSIQAISQDPALAGALSLTTTNNKTYVLTEAGILELTKDGVKKVVDDTNGFVAIAGWNGSIYSLDQVNSTIWKHPITANGFGQKQAWLKEGTELLPNPRTMLVDGKVWVLSSDGLLRPYLTGKEDTFETPLLKTTPPVLVLSTDPNSTKILYSDSGNNLYLHQKTGTLLSQYNFAVPEKLKYAAIDESANRLLLVGDDNHVYYLGL